MEIEESSPHTTEEVVTESHDPVLQAARLGWQTVEVFGRIRSQKRYGDRQKSEDKGQKKDDRFRFTMSSDRTARIDLLISISQLEALVRTLLFTLPPPPALPKTEPELNKFLPEVDLATLHGQFDDWSQSVWVKISAKDALAGRAFTYGGFLADTYWQARSLGKDNFIHLLNKYRLETIAERFTSIDPHLPSNTAMIVEYSLSQWGRKASKEPSSDDRRHMLRRLESQAGVWRSVLFGTRTADSYLKANDKREVRWRSALLTAVIILLIALLVWLAVFGLTRLGAWLTPGDFSVEEIFDTSLADQLLDFQTISTIVATLSSVVVVIIGMINRVSGWILQFYQGSDSYFTLRRIKHRTLKT